MKEVIILPETTKNPITLIGKRAGICWSADVSDDLKNYKRGLECIWANHGRTLEFVNVEVHFKGYNARVIREFYTHIGGMPTRLQASTRYLKYDDFEYDTPNSVERIEAAKALWESCINNIKDTRRVLRDEFNIPVEDTALLLPLGMHSDEVDKRNVRNYVDMSRNRMCIRANHQFRKMFMDLKDALWDYSDEWKMFISLTFKPKCEVLGYCTEKNSCGKYPKREMPEDLFKQIYGEPSSETE